MKIVFKYPFTDTFGRGGPPPPPPPRAPHGGGGNSLGPLPVESA
jgi:hypothetical protein